MQLLLDLGMTTTPTFLLMDRAYEGEPVRQLAIELGYVPVVPPKKNRLAPWEYDHEMYKRRNEVERVFRRLKGFRRVFSRFDKLDVMFLSFISFALIVEYLR
jgi:transposase